MNNSQETAEHDHPQADMQKLNCAMALIKKKILVLSGKGGVGKSTIAVNLAVELARQGSRVELAEDTGLDLLGSLPIDPQIAAGADAGLAIGDSPVSAPVHQVMNQILASLTEKMNASTSTKGETKTMKIAIPTAGGQLCMHFGHCEQFAMLTVDTNAKKITATESITPPPHEPGLLPKWLAEKNVQLIIAGGMGQRAQQLFSQNQIEVIAGAPADSPENLVTAYLNNTLQTGTNTCDH